MAILKTQSLGAGADVRILFERSLSIVGVDEFDERLRLELVSREAKRSLPRGI
jgi:hypothetical protein